MQRSVKYIVIMAISLQCLSYNASRAGTVTLKSSGGNSSVHGILVMNKDDTAIFTATSGGNDDYVDITGTFDNGTPTYTPSAGEGEPSVATVTYTAAAEGNDNVAHLKINSSASGVDCSVDKPLDLVVAVPKVTFQDSAGAAITVLKLGITHNGNDRTQHLKAVVAPPNAASALTIKSSSSITVSNPVNSTSPITFDAVGVTQSGSRGDGTLKAIITASNEDIVSSTTAVSILVPAAVGTPPTFDKDVTGVNLAINIDTVPAAPDVDSNHVLLVTEYAAVLDIPVNDQFGDSIGSLYKGAEVDEDSININVTLSSSGTYPDHVGKVPHKSGTDWYAKTDPEVATWLSGSDKAPLDSESWQDTHSIKIDAFDLSPGVNRTVTTTAPSHVKVSN